MGSSSWLADCAIIAVAYMAVAWVLALVLCGLKFQNDQTLNSADIRHFIRLGHSWPAIICFLLIVLATLAATALKSSFNERRAARRE